MVSCFLPANANSSELQCSLERIQNGQEITVFFGRNSKPITKQVKFCWKSLWFPLPGFLASCGSAFLRRWECGALAVLVPQLPGGTSSVSTTRSGDGLSSQLRVGMKSTQERRGPLPCLTEGRGVSLAYKCVCRQGDTDTLSKILARDPFFSLSHLHSLMQDPLMLLFLWRIGVWENEILLWGEGFLPWHNKSIYKKPPQVEINSRPGALLSDIFTR